MTEKLLPCPFCGGEPKLRTHRCAEDAMECHVECPTCEVRTTYYEDAYAPTADAIAAWNRRALSPRPDVMVEALRSKLNALPRYDRGLSWQLRNWQGSEELTVYGDIANLFKWVLDNTEALSAALSSHAPPQNVVVTGLRYRPNEFDDWGFIRNTDGSVFAVVRRPASEEELAEHRRAGSDPYEDLARRLMATFSRPALQDVEAFAAANPDFCRSTVSPASEMEGQR